MGRAETEPSRLGTLWDGCRVVPREQLRHEELPERVEAAPVGLLELDDLVAPRGAASAPSAVSGAPHVSEKCVKRGAAAPNAAAGGGGGASRAARGGRATAS